MSDFETTLQKTQNDIETLQAQIQNIIHSLTANHELFESDLVPITSSSNSTSSINTSTKSAYALLSQSFHFGQGQHSDLDADQNPPAIVIYEFDPSSTFLVPVVDKWVWCTTIINVSRESAPYPELNITVPSPKSLNATSSNQSPFSFEYTTHPVSSSSSTGQNEEFETNSNRILLDVPFQEAFYFAINGAHGEDGLSTYSKEKEPRISPGCKAWVTATFQDPIHFYGQDHKLNLYATLFSSGKFQWTQKIGLSVKKACLLYQDPKFAQFHSQILTGMTRYSHGFQLERILSSQSDKNLTSGLRRFLIYLKFKVIDSAQAATDPTNLVETYANFESSLLNGTLIKIQRDSAGESYNAKIVVLSRTKSQQTLFLRLVRAWISTESVSERRAGLRGILLTDLNTKMDQKLSDLCINEIELMTHLILLDSKGTLNENRHAGLNWFRVYVENLISTDLAFLVGFRKHLKL